MIRVVKYREARTQTMRESEWIWRERHDVHTWSRASLGVRYADTVGKPGEIVAGR